MPLAPKWVAILPLEKVQTVLDMMHHIDIALFQRHVSRQPLIITLNRGTYDGQLLSIIRDTYTELGWHVDITNQSGALTFTFTQPARQETS